MKPTLVVVSAFCISAVLAFHAAEAEEQVIFREVADGYNRLRIPAICITKAGTLLAFAEGREGGDAGDIDTILRRSEDGGKTWSPIQVVWSDGANTCGNPAPVVDYETGTVWLFNTWNLGSDREGAIMDGSSGNVRRAYLSKSDDDGRTWSKPVEMPHLRKPEWRWYATGPCHGIQLTRGAHQGRLVVPANNSDRIMSKNREQSYRSHIIYSDDHGQTWTLGGVLEPLTNESTVVELCDGSLMQNMRSYHGKHCRAVAVSRDGGVTFEKVYLDEALQSPVCQGNILRYSWPEDGRGRIVFSSPGGKGRTDMTLRISYDDGATWEAERVIYAGPSAYSNLVKLPDGQLGLLYEKGAKGPYETITFATFSMKTIEGK
jgi:sialidase-1